MGQTAAAFPIRAARAVGSALWQALLWVLFKLMQATVGGAFTVLILAQIAAAGVCRVVHTPRALRVVEEARKAQAAREAAAAAGDATAAAIDALEAGQPMHIFPDPTKGHDSLAWQLVGPYMRAFGRHAIANSQLFNPEYVHFYLPGVGALPYVLSDVYYRAAIFGTGEPLAARANWQQITEAFLQVFPGAKFYHVTEEYAALLADLGYYINGVGSETTLQVQSWKYSGKTRVIRASARSARDSGVRVRELGPGELTDELRHKLEHDVSGDWIAQKAVADRHLRVFVRHLDFEALQLQDGIRVWVAEAYPDPELAPPAYVDPVLQGSALNAKPPKPPRRSRSKGKLSGAPSLDSKRSASNASINSSSSVVLDIRANSTTTLTTAASAASLASMRSQEASAAPSAPSSVGSQSPPPPRAIELRTLRSSSVKGRSSSSSRVGRAAAGADGGSSDSSGLTDFDTAAVLDQGLGGRADPGSKTAAGRKGAPEVVGFVLLDPLWEQGQEVGYVTSMMRMKRSAHSGTLKLLTEDIISKLRQEGRQELTFGFAPLFNTQDGKVFKKYIHWCTWTALYLYHCANNVYAFKNLAHSKSRYGAGLNKTKDGFNDPNVTLTQVYAAYPSYIPGWLVLDLYAFFAFIGIIDNPFSVYAKLVGLKKGGENLK